MGKAATAKLASYQKRYRDLAAQLGAIGYIASGSLAQRYNKCGKANCACHADPPRLHGPYWQWTAKVDGKTINKRMTDSEARLYQEWIANDRKARALIAQMRAIAAQAATVIIAQDTGQPGTQRPDTHPRTRSPQTPTPATRTRPNNP